MYNNTKVSITARVKFKISNYVNRRVIHCAIVPIQNRIKLKSKQSIFLNNFLKYNNLFYLKNC